MNAARLRLVALTFGTEGDSRPMVALCRGLKQARYKELDVIDGEPTLVDFILDRVPERSAPVT